jgi:hypothetical protein
MVLELTERQLEILNVALVLLGARVRSPAPMMALDSYEEEHRLLREGLTFPDGSNRLTFEEVEMLRAMVGGKPLGLEKRRDDSVS